MSNRGSNRGSNRQCQQSRDMTAGLYDYTVNKHLPSSHAVGSANAPKLPQDCEASVQKHIHDCILQRSCLGIHCSSGLLKTAAGAFNSLPNSKSGALSLQLTSLQLCNCQGVVLPYLISHSIALKHSGPKARASSILTKSMSSQEY